uniref:Uncharacterized protein n=1 Tax=Leersia perrieri TaxID=77586 RepID=A0A0D9WVF6_9ORYZ
MAMRALVSKLRMIPPPVASSAAATQDELLHRAIARAIAKESSYDPFAEIRLKVKQMHERDLRDQRRMMWYQAIGNFFAFSATVFVFHLCQKEDKVEESLDKS